MGCLQRIFNIILNGIGLGRRSRPEDIPKKLPPHALQKAMEEARWLHSQHAVNVQSLKSGELPGIPRRADAPQERADEPT